MLIVLTLKSFAEMWINLSHHDTLNRLVMKFLINLLKKQLNLINAAVFIQVRLRGRKNEIV
jgi:hypothetical protein